MATPSVAEKIADTQIEGRGVNDDLPPDNTGPEDHGSPAPRAREADTDREAPPVPANRRRLDKRDAIAARFKTGRGTNNEAAEDAAEILAFANQGLPPGMTEKPVVAAEEEAELPADREEEIPEQPVAKRKLNVRGREVELTEDELVAAAQRGLAGDSYFEEGRRTADEAKAALERVNVLLRDAPKGNRTPAGEHPAGEEAETPERGSAEHPELDPFVETVRLISYEDPEKAAASLRDLVRGEVQTASKQSATDAVEHERQRDELARNRKTLDAFKSDHADIANDPLAVTVVKTKVAEKQHEDLVAIGYDPAVLPRPDDLQEIGRWHLFARSKGFKVRSVETLLDEGTKDYQAWKGGGENDVVVEPPKGKPRVEVRLDRSERRANIPQQPSRAATPRPDADTPQPKNRSDVVAAMARTRNLARGRITA